MSLLALVLAASVAAPPADDIDAARDAHDKAVETARDNVLTALRAAENRVRAAPGSAEARSRAVARLKADAEAFTGHARLPASPEAGRAAGNYLRAVQAPRADLLKALDRAADARVRAGDDDRANALLAEKRELRAVFAAHPGTPIMARHPSPDDLAVRRFAADPAGYLNGKTVTFVRITGFGARSLELRPGGLTRERDDYPSDKRWELREGRVILATADGRPTTVFDAAWARAGKLLLSGPFLLEPGVIHVFEER